MELMHLILNLFYKESSNMINIFRYCSLLGTYCLYTIVPKKLELENLPLKLKRRFQLWHESKIPCCIDLVYYYYRQAERL